MPIFSLTYEIVHADGSTELVTQTGEYDDLEWAEDHAYTLADKGYYKVEQINE